MILTPRDHYEARQFRKNQKQYPSADPRRELPPQKLGDILNPARAKSGPVVYLLFNDANDLIYVGKTSNVLRRLGQHQDVGKDWRRVRIIACKDIDHMTMLEKELIRFYQPPLNKVRYRDGSGVSVA